MQLEHKFILSSFAIAAIAAAIPAAEASWPSSSSCQRGGSCSGGIPRNLVDRRSQYYRDAPSSRASSRSFDLVSDIFTMPISFNSLMRQHDAQVTRMQQSALTNPRYDISEEEDKFELALELPGVKIEDVVVEVEEEGKVLRISGSRNVRKHGHLVSSQFDQMFTLDDSIVDVDNASVTMSDGVLLVTAPKIQRKTEKNRRIPVTTESRRDMSEVNVVGNDGDGVVEEARENVATNENKEVQKNVAEDDEFEITED